MSGTIMVGTETSCLLATSEEVRGYLLYIRLLVRFFTDQSVQTTVQHRDNAGAT
jgi:hypothetical protein